MADSIVISPEVRLGRLERELQRMVNQARKASGETERSFNSIQQGANVGERSLKRTGFAVGNLSAQLNDIGVSLAGGQSPFQVMLQQGTQLNQIFQQTGSNAATFFGLMKQSVIGLINPFSLATFAAIGLGGAVLQYFGRATEDINMADEALKNHAEVIKTLKEAYGEALKGVEEYARESDAIMRQIAERDIANLTQTLMSEIRTVISSIGSLVDADAFGGARAFRQTEVFAQMQAAITSLQASVASGEPDIRSFREAIVALREIDPSNQAIVDLVNNILTLTDAGMDVQGALDVATGAISAVGSVAAGQIESVNALTAALNALANIAVPALSSADQISRNMREGLRNAQSEEDRRRVLAQTAAARERLANQSLPGGGAIPTPERKPVLLGIPLPKASGGGRSRSGGGGGVSDADAFAERLETMQQRVEAMKAETAALSQLNPLQNDYGRTLTFVKTQQELLAEAKKRDIELTPEQIAAIDNMAASMADASAAAAQLAEKQRDIRQSAEEFNNFQKDVMKGFITDLRNGVDETEALGNALGKITDRLIDIALNNVFNNSGGGGILGMLFGGGGGGGFGAQWNFAKAGGIGLYANGTANTGGSRGQAMGIVHGQEAVIPLPSGGKVPVDMRGATMGQTQPIRLIVEAQEGEMFKPVVRAESRNVSLQVVKGYNKAEETRRRNGGN